MAESTAAIPQNPVRGSFSISSPSSTAYSRHSEPSVEERLGLGRQSRSGSKIPRISSHSKSRKSQTRSSTFGGSRYASLRLSLQADPALINAQRRESVMVNEKEVNTLLKDVVDATMQVEVGRTSVVRWWVLLLFGLGSFNNAMVSQTYSSVPDTTKEYYGVDDDVITLLLGYGAFLPFLLMLPTAALLQKRYGLLTCIKLGALLVALGSLFRLIPSFRTGVWRASHPTTVLACLHLGQIINGSAFSLFMASPSKLSQVWFPPENRTTITAIASLCAEVGLCAAFLVAKFVHDERELELLLWSEFLVSAFTALCAITLWWVPDEPFASTSAADLVHRLADSKDSIFAQVKSAAMNRPFAILAPTIGIASGCFTGWVPQLPTLLESPTISVEEGDNLSFMADLSAIIGGFLVGPIADYVFRQRYKRLAIILCVLQTLSLLSFTILVPNSFAPHKAMPKPEALYGPVIVAGLVQGAIIPVSYEWCAELAFPLSEGTSGGLYQLFVTMGTGLFVVLCIPIPEVHRSGLVTLVMIASVCLLPLVKEQYRRLTVNEYRHNVEQAEEEMHTRNGEFLHGVSSDYSLN